MNASERMTKLLTEQGRTERELADYLNISYNTVRVWKNKQPIPPAEHLASIAEFLGISVKYLLTGEAEKYQEKLTPEEICKYLDVSVEYILTGKGSSITQQELVNPELRRDETELVTYYRKLSIPQKGQLLGTIKATVHKEQLLY